MNHASKIKGELGSPEFTEVRTPGSFPGPGICNPGFVGNAVASSREQSLCQVPQDLNILFVLFDRLFKIIWYIIWL